MLRDRPLLAGSIIVVAAAAMFGILGPASRFAYDQGMEPLPFVAWRAVVGAVLLGFLVVAGVSRGRPVVRRAALNLQSAISLGIAALMVLVLSLAMFAAFSRTTVALVLLGFYTFPAMVAAVAFVLGRERPTPGKIAALALALGGMVLVVVGNLNGGPGVTVDTIGVLLALGAAVAQTVFVTVSRHGYPAVPADQAMTFILVGTFVGCAGIAVAAGSTDALLHPLREPGVLPILLVAGSVGAAIPSLLFLIGIRRIGGTRAGILMLFEPVVGVILAAALLDEALTLVQGIGGGGILAAALILQRSGGPLPPAYRPPLPNPEHRLESGE